MTLLRVVLILGAFALSGLIVWAMGAASFGASFEAISSDPWGLVTLVDLSLGFLVASIVIALVERPLVAAVWIVALVVLGNLVSAVWLAWRLARVAPALRSAG